MKKTLMLVDDNAKTITEMKDFFSAADSRYSVVGEAYDGVSALKLFRIHKPDLMILDLVMPNMDGFSVLKHIAKGGSKIIVHSALSHERFISKAMGLGADYYLVKPVSLYGVEECANELLSAYPDAPSFSAKADRGYSLDEKIMRIFVTIGIPANLKGYQFLREAVKKTMDNPKLIDNITKRLYPEVAQFFDTSPARVERSMRHAIEVACNRDAIKNINYIFGMNIYQQYEKPTNGQLIALVADKMLLEQNAARYSGIAAP